MSEDRRSIRTLTDDEVAAVSGGNWIVLMAAIGAADVINDFMNGLSDGFCQRAN